LCFGFPDQPNAATHMPNIGGAARFAILHTTGYLFTNKVKEMQSIDKCRFEAA
jgi:hypothetical protein